MEDMNFYRSAPCLNHLNDILFERKALDFRAARFKPGCIPSALCWLFTANSSTIDERQTMDTPHVHITTKYALCCIGLECFPLWFLLQRRRNKDGVQFLVSRHPQHLSYPITPHGGKMAKLVGE